MTAAFKHDQSTPIHYRMPDANGDVPDVTVVGARFRHVSNGKTYTVRELVFLGDYDKWAYSMVEGEGDIPIIRSHRNFHGRLSDGRVRFERV